MDFCSQTARRCMFPLIYRPSSQRWFGQAPRLRSATTNQMVTDRGPAGFKRLSMAKLVISMERFLRTARSFDCHHRSPPHRQTCSRQDKSSPCKVGCSAPLMAGSLMLRQSVRPRRRQLFCLLRPVVSLHPRLLRAALDHRRGHRDGEQPEPRVACWPWPHPVAKPSTVVQ
jgi:hypothetical protein